MCGDKRVLIDINTDNRNVLIIVMKESGSFHRTKLVKLFEYCKTVILPGFTECVWVSHPTEDGSTDP